MPTWLAILIWLIVIAFAYAFLPEVLMHHLGIGVVKSVPGSASVASLTFDDGPGESTAPVLDLLAAHNAHATFFVVGEEVARRPDLVTRITAEGHEVANHGLFHRRAWLMGPVATFRQIDDGAVATAAAFRRRPALFRPPWGQFNAFTMWAAARSAQTVVLWSVNIGDWMSRPGPELLAQRIVAGARDGNVLLLHDAGGDGRQRTVKALALALPQLQEKNIELVTVSELIARQGRRVHLITSVWNTWETVFDRLYSADDLGPDALFRLTRVVWKGRDLDLGGGRVLKRGMPFGEIHFKNEMLGRLGAIRGLKEFKRSMGILADWARTHEKYSDIEYFLGTTVLARPAEAVGFHAVDLPPGIGRWWARLYRYWLILVYHPEGGRRLSGHRSEKLEVRLAYITRDGLLERYGGGVHA